MSLGKPAIFTDENTNAKEYKSRSNYYGTYYEKFDQHSFFLNFPYNRKAHKVKAKHAKMFFNN